MKTLILATAAAFALAAPLAAQTPSDVANAIFAQSHESGDGARYDASFAPSATGDTVDAALILFAADQEAEGDRQILQNAEGGMVISSSSATAATAAFAKAHLAATGEDKR